MITDEQLADALSKAFRDLSTERALSPDLADRIVYRGRAARRRARLAAGVATGALVLVVGLVVLMSGRPAPLAHTSQTQLRLASYTFKLPAGAHAVPATPSACALGAGVIYLPGPGEGASRADQPPIASAVTSAGGCVSMILTNPYVAGAPNAPEEPFPAIDKQSVQIGSYIGTLGTYEIIGSDMTINGVPIPSGTQQVVLNLQIPAQGGEIRDLQVAAAGITEQQLVSIVTSGLSAQPGDTANLATSANAVGSRK